ncbi:MAG: hypothetical protein L0I76_28090 [Pseudonocardia sp.]|nr:hypothetical protein [Pseudonocardia sp.]
MPSAVGGVRVVGRARTALDVAIATPDGSGSADRALQKHVRFPDLYRAYCRMLGSAGSAQAGRLIVAAADRADSAAERLLVRHLRGAGVTGWVGGRIRSSARTWSTSRSRTSVWRSRWTAGPGTSTSNGSAPDRRKGNALVGSGWDLLRYTWHDLTCSAAQVVDEIESARRGEHRATTERRP